MQAGSEDYHLFRAAHGFHHSQIYSEEEMCPGSPAELSGTGSTHRVVSLPALSCLNSVKLILSLVFFCRG